MQLSAKFAVLVLNIALAVCGYLLLSNTSRFLPIPRVMFFRRPSEFDDLSTVKYVFPTNISSLPSNESCVVRRAIDILKVMHDYSKHSRTINRTAKVILRVGNFNWEGYSDGIDLFKDCPVKNCRTTSDYTNERLTADVLLITQFHGGVLKDYLPKPKNQIWIVRHMESPRANRIDPNVLGDGLVNWTITYRAESTMPIPYPPQYLPKVYVEQTYAPFIPAKNYASTKSKKVAWMVSNCGGGNGRRPYADELSRYIDVDIYGGCGKHRCGPNCQQTLRNYKFYLAFENQNCIEYTTEKVVNNAMTNDIIPIVMGARPEDYKNLLPPDSYLHVDDFRSPKYLAEYLHTLDKNDTLYNSYFRWKATWMAVPSSIFDGYGYCRMCFMLHYRDDVNYVNWYEGKTYSNWWNSACSAGWSEEGSWATWRPPKFWSTTNATSFHQPPSL